MYRLSYLLRRHVEGDRPEVHLLVGVDAGQDEEQARALCTTWTVPCCGKGGRKVALTLESCIYSCHCIQMYCNVCTLDLRESERGDSLVRQSLYHNRKVLDKTIL